MNNQIDENLEKKRRKRETKEKQILKKENKKGLVFKKHVRLKKETFFQKKERERQTCKDMYFLFKEKLTKK